MTRRFFSGKTLDQAVMLAARHYEVDPQELQYHQIEKRHGFLRTRKAVMIAVDPEQPRREPGAAAAAPPSPVREPEPRPAPQTAERAAPVRKPETPRAERDEPSELRPAARVEEPRVEESGVEEPRVEEPKPEMVHDEPEMAREPKAARPTERPAAAEPRPADDARDSLDEAEDEELLEAAERASQILLRFAGIDAEATAREGEERIEVEIEGPDESVLVVEGGKGLLSIQHLLPRMLRGLTGRSSFVRADSGGFHQKRRDRLEALALKEAEAASRDGAPRTLPPMAPDERRIVHLALKESPTVVTESHGTGLHKRVVIRPADGFDEPGDIEARHGF